VHATCFYGKLDERTGKRDGQGPCKNFKDWAQGPKDRRKDKLKERVLRTMEYYYGQYKAQEDSAASGDDGHISEESSSDDGLPSVLTLGARMWAEHIAAEEASKQKSEAQKAAVDRYRAQKEAAEKTLGLLSPGQGVEAPTNLDFELDEGHHAGLAVLGKNKGTMPDEFTFYVISIYIVFPSQQMTSTMNDLFYSFNAASMYLLKHGPRVAAGPIAAVRSAVPRHQSTLMMRVISNPLPTTEAVQLGKTRNNWPLPLQKKSLTQKLPSGTKKNPRNFDYHDNIDNFVIDLTKGVDNIGGDIDKLSASIQDSPNTKKLKKQSIINSNLDQLYSELERDEMKSRDTADTLAEI
jgi:hypothetical protein